MAEMRTNAIDTHLCADLIHLPGKFVAGTSATTCESHMFL